MRTFLLFLFALFFIKSYSQESSRVLITQTPLKDGKITLFESGIRLIDPLPSVLIESDSPIVFSVSKGKVINIKRIESGYLIILCSANKYVTYSSLNSVDCSIGEKIKKRQIIGKLNDKNEAGKYNLDFHVLNQGYSSSYNMTLRFLKRYNGIKK